LSNDQKEDQKEEGGGKQYKHTATPNDADSTLDEYVNMDGGKMIMPSSK
jgi:hypothetical protein